jgi:MFS family permease
MSGLARRIRHRTMPLVTLHHPADAATAERLLSPRDDVLVAETAASSEDGASVFELVEGPFTSWRRRVHRHDDGITEEIDFRLALPLWSMVFTPLLRRELRRNAGRPRLEGVPWWSPPNRLDARAARSLAAASTLAVVGGYIGGLLATTLTFVAGDLGGGLRAQSAALAVARIGALGTAAGMAFADRRGRKPVIVWSFVIASAAAVVLAASPDLAFWAGGQVIVRGAIATGALLLPVAASEELPAGSRAFGVALVTMAGGLGIGILTVLLAVVGSGGWRLLHLLAVIAIPATFAVARQLPESRRFERLVQDTAATGGTASDHHHMRIQRLVLLGVGAVLLWAFVTPVTQLQNTYLHDERGFSSQMVSLFIIVTNAGGILGVVAGGRLADRRSRHLVASIGLVGLAVGNTVMFAFAGLPMWLGSTVGSIVGGATIPSIGVLNPELFPTSRRGLANGLLNLAAVGGSVLGLLLVPTLVDWSGYGTAIALLALGPLLVIVVLRWIPEGARRSLEDLNLSDEELSEAATSTTPPPPRRSPRPPP